VIRWRIQWHHEGVGEQFKILDIGLLGTIGLDPQHHSRCKNESRYRSVETSIPEMAFIGQPPLSLGFGTNATGVKEEILIKAAVGFFAG
jgi:hypothetical protein